MSDVGYNFFGNEWFEYGTCDYFCIDLFQYRYFGGEEALVRIPAYIVIIATFVTVVQLCMEAYTPALYASLGLYIPLIVVNCIVLGRAESFAAKNGVVASAFDGIGIGLGFTWALALLGACRELLGSGKLFGVTLMPEEYGSLIFILAPGAFIVLGYLIAIVNKLRKA